MLTAFAILLPCPDLSGGSAAALVVASVCGGNTHSETVLLLSVGAFALATVVCWYFYGSVCSRYLFGRRADGAFLLLYASSVLVGAVVDCSVLASLSDVLLLVLSLLTLPVIIKSSDRIRALSETCGLID